MIFRIGNKGIVLVEICFVGVILSVLLLISWPHLNTFARSSELKSACKSITHTMRYFREKALVESKHYSIEFDIPSNDYLLKEETNPISNPGKFELVRESITGFEWNKKIRIRDVSRNRIIFRPDGTAEDIKISLQNLKGEIYEIKRNGMTGKCAITKK